MHMSLFIMKLTTREEPHMKRVFITVDHLPDCIRMHIVKVGQELTLRKDNKNPYDDEAIKVFNRNGAEVGYVANSVGTVARGTYSAGRIYDKIEDGHKCTIRFIVEDCLIAEMACEEKKNAIE